MVVDSVVRWQLVRDVIVNRKSGVLVLQTGRNYLNWTLDKGNLVSISTTFVEGSFTHFVQEKKLTESTKFLSAQNQIDPEKALGSLLIRHHIMNDEEFSKILFEHWISCTDYLFDPAVHIFWSTNRSALKSEFVRMDRPLGEVLLRARMDSITVPTALRSVQELKPPYHVHSSNPNLAHFSEEEKRVWMYLRSGSTLKQILQDPDIARIPCYKTVFLLWLSGYISDSRKVQPQPLPKITTNILEKIPPEWVFPLCAGALIGVLLAPASAPKTAPSPVPRVEPLNETLQKPAWSDEEKKDFNAETQRGRDERE